MKRLSLKDLIDTSEAQIPFSRTVAAQDEGTLRSTMVCVVAVVGEVRVRLGLTPSGPNRWAIFASIAGSGVPLGLTSGNGSLPSYFAALPNPPAYPYPGSVVEIVGPQTVRVKFESPMVSAEFGNPALLQANEYTEIAPVAATIAATRVKVGDRVQVFFEREGRDASGAYPLSVFHLVPTVATTPQVPTPPSTVLPICPPGQTPLLDVSSTPPPGDQPGTGAASAQEAFRKANPTITDFTMYPFGSDQPTRDPRVLGQGPAWIVAGSETFISLYIGAPGQNSWFAHPAKFQGCMIPPSTSLRPGGFTLPAGCTFASNGVESGRRYLWLVDCGAEANAHAAATLGASFLAQGWVACAGSGSPTWLKGEYALTVTDASDTSGGKIGLTQSPREIVSCG